MQFSQEGENPSYFSLLDSVLTLIVARCTGSIWICQPGRTLVCLWPFFQCRIMCFVPRFVTQSSGGQIASGMLDTFELIRDIVVELIRSHVTDVWFFPPIYVTSFLTELKLKFCRNLLLRWVILTDLHLSGACGIEWWELFRLLLCKWLLTKLCGGGEFNYWPEQLLPHYWPRVALIWECGSIFSLFVPV